ncbi:hypothetical protein HLH26_11860 [Gluconacetobacter sp. 1b LMG 1731]|uniref:histidine kinase n=1 Tax=Gluconacetobacter dulcium TaxID=2729096 RepID=A0A7W4ILU2_9PROT|nr:ATP-binding protein [Gluconacetobacter dulcium]MBB2165216.1 hypothetical protein [Gluconacetobacter dulcium]MBB2194375.1 hypothetical protein [Gluconacetobacter dulcium]
MRARSLTTAVYIRVLLLLISLGTAAGGVAYFMARADVERASDHSLILSANMLYALMQEELAAAPAASFPATLLSSEDKLAFRTGARSRMFAVFVHGTCIVHSEDAPSPDIIPQTPGFHYFDHGLWRAYGLEIPQHGLRIVVAERRADIDQTITSFLRQITLPLNILVVASAILLWVMLRSGLAEMRRLSLQLDRRSFHDLEPLDPQVWSRELSGLVGKLNTLLERVRTGIQHEQMFTDAAAHQLRTPLAALRLHAELLTRDAAIASNRIQPLLDCVTQASALIDRMLLLARLDTTAPAMTEFDIAALIATVLSSHALLAVQSGVAFSFEIHAMCRIVSDQALLEIALAALVENSITHAACGGAIDIHVHDLRKGALCMVCIDIADRGPGIPKSCRSRVFDRFYQLREGYGGGHGLGLSIAARAIEILDGTIELGDRIDGPGLVASILLPQPCSLA